VTLGKEKMEKFDYQHLDGFTLEAENAAIRIDYSEPDQGGTRLLHRFRFFANGRINRENGYAGDSELQTKDIGRDAVPPRVLSDGTSWIEQQTQIAAAHPKLIETLNRIQAALKG
jgi:hypothetical protein